MQAYVPVQEVVDGRVRIMVSESVLGNVAIDVADGTPLQRERVARTLAVLEAGKPLNGPRYERAMLLLSDLPGVKPQSAISAGTTAGTTDQPTGAATRRGPLRVVLGHERIGNVAGRAVARHGRHGQMIL